MDKKVYYEEYTLKYWIELLLKKDLELPPYQRSFVWTDGQVKQSRTPNYIVHRLHYEGMILLDLTKTK